MNARTKWIVGWHLIALYLLPLHDTRAPCARYGQTSILNRRQGRIQELSKRGDRGGHIRYIYLQIIKHKYRSFIYSNFHYNTFKGVVTPSPPLYPPLITDASAVRFSGAPCWGVGDSNPPPPMSGEFYALKRAISAPNRTPPASRKYILVAIPVWSTGFGPRAVQNE